MRFNDTDSNEYFNLHDIKETKLYYLNQICLQNIQDIVRFDDKYPGKISKACIGIKLVCSAPVCLSASKTISLKKLKSEKKKKTKLRSEKCYLTTKQRGNEKLTICLLVLKCVLTRLSRQLTTQLPTMLASHLDFLDNSLAASLTTYRLVLNRVAAALPPKRLVDDFITAIELPFGRLDLIALG